jgi:hypothetical protein
LDSIENEDDTFTESEMHDEPRTLTLTPSAQVAVSQHYDNILNDLVQRETVPPSEMQETEARAASSSLLRSVLGSDIVLEDEKQDEEEEEEEQDEEEEEEEQDEKEEHISLTCECSLCAAMDEIDKKWITWQPTEPWQYTLYSALQKAFERMDTTDD